MATDIETIIRAPQAYALAGRAIQLMQEAQKLCRVSAFIPPRTVSP